jgi:type III pantothenate kinase
MLWAIDIGNTHAVVGLHDGGHWRAVWRVSTQTQGTEDELAATFEALCRVAGLEFKASAAVVASVVPSATRSWLDFCERWLGVPPRVLERGDQVGIEVTYDPPHAVGADRIANALAALQQIGAPCVVVDFGTATTFDCIDAAGRYIGGAILPGVLVSVEALASRAAKLPPIALREPEAAVGRNTVQALESGVMFGYAGAVDAVARRIRTELGGAAHVVGTGGLAEAFADLCEELDSVDPMLTLEGLRAASRLLDPSL